MTITFSSEIKIKNKDVSTGVIVESLKKHKSFKYRLQESELPGDLVGSNANG